MPQLYYKVGSDGVVTPDGRQIMANIMDDWQQSQIDAATLTRY